MTKVYLLKDEKTVELFNSMPVAQEQQREMTVAEHNEGLRLYEQAKHFAEEFINRPYCRYEIERILNKVHRTPNTIMYNGSTDVDSYLQTGNEYIDIYFQGELVDISITLTAWEVGDEMTLSKMFDVEVKNKGLDYAYESLQEDDETVILETKEDIEKFYNKEL